MDSAAASVSSQLGISDRCQGGTLEFIVARVVAKELKRLAILARNENMMRTIPQSARTAITTCDSDVYHTRATVHKVLHVHTL